MAFDSARGRVVLFGGASGSLRADTYEWDGSDWAMRGSPVSPSARFAHALAYDSLRSRVLLFGGEDANQKQFADCWEWDGTAWSARMQGDPVGGDFVAVAYDESRARVVLFGGQEDPRFPSSETFEWDGFTWTTFLPAARPVGRTNHALAYDRVRRRTVLFGGLAVSTTLSDTWEWDGGLWTRLFPTNPPSARGGHALAYDDARGRVVLFGGATASGLSAETWDWDGNTWTQRLPTTAPPARCGHALAYDSARGRTVLFGGISGSAPTLTYRSDTWEWDGAVWTNRTQAVQPPARAFHSLAYDIGRGRTVLFGGTNGSGVLGDTWEWDGATWVQRTPAFPPSARAFHAAAYDSARSMTVLVGGQGGHGGTWEYAPEHAASFSTFGAGCAGTAGVPVLGASAGARPWLGESFGIRLSNLPSGAAVMVFLGSSKALWGPLQLPFALDPIGMTGCALAVSGEWTVPLQAIGGSASLAIPLPNNAGLVGGSFFQQGFALDPGANRAGITASNAGEGRIGSK